MPGYIKNVGDHIRMRWVQPGFDPDATDVPPNKVIFDSDDAGALSVLAVGSVTLPYSHQYSYLQVVTWDFDYVPLCLIQFDWNDGFTHNCCGSSISNNSHVNIRKDGIWWRGPGTSFILIYTVFNIKASDG